MARRFASPLRTEVELPPPSLWQRPKQQTCPAKVFQPYLPVGCCPLRAPSGAFPVWPLKPESFAHTCEVIQN